MIDNGISSEKICMYASSPAGMSHDFDTSPVTQRRLDHLVSDGCLELRQRVVHLPGFDMPESCKAVAMFDTWSPRTITIRTYHLLRWQER